MHALYLADTAPSVGLKAFPWIMASTSEIDDKTLEFSRALFKGALEHQDPIDEKIKDTAKNWPLARMAAVDRSLLRLAAYELLFCPETPVNVIIDEAIEIARKYSTEDSTRFINGILDKLKELRAAGNGSKKSAG